MSYTLQRLKYLCIKFNSRYKKLYIVYRTWWHPKWWYFQLLRLMLYPLTFLNEWDEIISKYTGFLRKFCPQKLLVLAKHSPTTVQVSSNIVTTWTVSICSYFSMRFELKNLRHNVYLIKQEAFVYLLSIK